MFVIVQSLENLESQEEDKTPEEKIGLTMKHAGISITVTSLTDVLAFGIGAVTSFPGLKSFCITCSLVITLILILQVL